MDYEKMLDEFESLSGQEQWEWMLKYKDEITLFMDNDYTDFTFDAEDKTDDCTLFSFKDDIGNRYGLKNLFGALNIKAVSA